MKTLVFRFFMSVVEKKHQADSIFPGHAAMVVGSEPRLEAIVVGQKNPSYLLKYSIPNSLNYVSRRVLRICEDTAPIFRSFV